MARKGQDKKQSDKLNLRQLTFAIEYINTNGNATQAALNAGYSPKGASSQAVELLANPKVALKIAELSDKFLQKHETSAQSIVDELALLGLKVGITDVMDFSGPIPKLKNLDEVPREITRCIESISVVPFRLESGKITLRTVVKMHSKTAALGILAKHFGILKDVIEHQHRHEHVHKYDLTGLSRQELEALQGILHKASDNNQPEPAGAGTFGAN